MHESLGLFWDKISAVGLKVQLFKKNNPFVTYTFLFSISIYSICEVFYRPGVSGAVL